MGALTSKMQQAAALIGQGRYQYEVAADVGVHKGTVKRWMKREDFWAAVEKSRKALLADNPGPQATLESALTASRRDGIPDWPVRVQAARALLGREPAGESPAEKVDQARTTIFRDRLAE